MKPVPSLLAALLLSPSAEGAVLEVCAGCAYAHLDTAVLDAVINDTIRVGPGDYALSTTLTHSLTIVGSGPQKTRIYCSDEVDQLATIDTTEGDHILDVRDLTVERCANNRSTGEDRGWAVRLASDTTNTFSNVWVDPVDSSSTVPEAGGLFSVGSADLTLVGVEILPDSSGDPLFVDGTGGVLVGTDAVIIVVGGHFIGDAWDDGGCFSLTRSALEVYGATFTGCAAANGGALHLDGDGVGSGIPVHLENVHFNDSFGDFAGGSIEV